MIKNKCMEWFNNQIITLKDSLINKISINMLKLKLELSYSQSWKNLSTVS